MANNSSEERISQKLSTDNSSKKGPGSIASVAVILVVTVAIIVTVVLVLSGGDKGERKAIVTPDNVDEIISDMQDNKVDPGMYEVTMNTTWDFNDGDSASSNAYVENSTANSNDVYFNIVRSDTGEEIYSSPIIPIGSHLEDITLDKSLDKGEHACVLTYHLLDENEEEESTLMINLTIRVHN
ncbi:MAG: hypothetical protein J6C01_07105 [Lachnospiraceae bacterium]|nr:hypothetical protein [Lachnospiraceae bacterium]